MYRYTIVLFCFVYAVTVHSQSMDLSFCDPAKLPAVNPPLPYPLPSILSQYEMSTEMNNGLIKQTIEVDEYFDGLLNRAVMIIRENGLEVKYIYNDNFNEVITISGDLCYAAKVNETNGPIQNVLLNGTEHILPGLLYIHLLNLNINEVYIGKSVVRGIPVNQWQSCVYEPVSKVTAKLTYSVSDPTQWSIAVPAGNITSVIVEVNYENKLPNGTTWTQTVSVTKYRPGILTKDEFWVTPQGVYCQNRQPGKPIPTVPNAFKFSSTVVSPLYGYDELIGQIATIKQEYDYKNKLYRIDYSVKNNPIVEIHDFNKGLRYIIDKFRGNCSLKQITPDEPGATMIGSDIHMKDPLDFFDFEKVKYQYVGQKHVNHVNTDVWIGMTTMSNITVLKEWHFVASGWVIQSDLAVEVGEPFLLIITYLKPTKNNNYIKIPIYYYINDFDESGLTLWDFDLSPCYNNLPKRHFMFNLPTDYRNEMESNKGILWLGTLLALESNLAVSRLRISRLNIEFDVDKIFAMFTLLEKPPQIGFVNNSSIEATLDEASKLLNATIQAGKLLIPFETDATGAVDIQVLNDSLKEFDRGTGNIVYVNDTVYIIKPEYINVTQYINRTEYVNNTIYIKEKVTEGYSEGTVIGIAIGLLAVGLLIGIIFGVFFCVYKQNLLPLSGSPQLDKSVGLKNLNFDDNNSSS